MNLSIINGPNINMVGLREKEIYGLVQYEDICKELHTYCRKLAINLEIYQSNYEGAIVDKIQSLYKKVAGIIINPAAYSHTSIAILDALKAVAIPTVEVHFSDISSREDFRRHSYVSLYAEKFISGKGHHGYKEAIDYLFEKYG